MDLPAGLRHRPLLPDDAGAVVEVMAAQEQHDLGRVEIELADIVGDWRRPGFDLTASTVGVLDGDLLVAYGEVGLPERGDAAVRPDHRGRGIGTALAGWMRHTARDRGWSRVGMPVPRGSAGDDLLTSLGYHVRWTSWALGLPERGAVPARPLPPGYDVRAAAPADHEQIWTVQEDAFLEWSARERVPFPDWRAEVLGRPGFQPWNLRVVTDPAGDVVAMAWVQLGARTAFVARLATRPDQRGRGLAQALLVDAFAAGREYGATDFELSTDSRTGALGLYERVGMVVTSTWVHRAIEL